MKLIEKNGCPPDYTHWCRSVAGTEQEDYEEIPKKCKNTLKAVLLEEQGFICGYTMKRIDQDNAHIEHIKPQHVCKVEKRGLKLGLDLDYGNMIACYPEKNNKGEPLYGAHKKGKWWENNGIDFISPLDNSCQRSFRFDLDGKITALNPKAFKTIEVLALDNSSLTQIRGRVIYEHIYGSAGVKSICQANRKMERILEKDGRGKYHEFCIAIHDALQEHIKTLEKASKRKKYVKKK
jgi:uncharacterized protein (TIGR02646 family)